MIRSTLKEATALHHTRLEARLDLLRPTMSLEHYSALLRKFYGYYLPFEDTVANFMNDNSDGFDFERRLKAPLLERDLTALGVEQTEINDVPRCPESHFAAMNDAPSIFGSLYVTEGSTLGGQPLSRHFQTTLNITPETGGAFFASYGSNVGPMWRSFIEALELRVPHNEIEAATKAACATFSSMEEWLLDSEAAGSGGANVRS